MCMKSKTMHKTQALAVALAIVFGSGFLNAFAQDADPAPSGGGTGELQIGAKLGVNFNQFNQPLTAIGGNAGGFVRYTVLDFLEVQGELLYSLQGGGRMEYTRNLNLNFAGGTFDGPIDNMRYVNRTVYLNNIEVPVIARLGLPELNGGAIVPKFIVGGSYSFNFSAIEQNDKIINFVDGTRGLVSNTYDNVSLNYFKHNFSAYVGMAMDFHLADAKVFTMEFRYRRGFNNLNQVETNITELTDKLYSSGFSINFSYRIF